MRKFGCFVTIILLVFCVFIFTGCTTKNVIKYYLNNDGELIVEFDNDTTENLGEWNSTIVSSLGSVGISATGYYVINGVQTEIRVVYETVSISNDGYYIVNGIKTNISVEYDSVSISDDGYYVINGIKTEIVATHYYTVSFETGFDAQVQSQRIEEGYRVSKPELERDGYSFDGWYCNDEKWIFNSDTVIGDITLTAHWTANVYQVSFVNEKGDNPASINVEFDSNVTLPILDEVEGYQFDGWYNNNTLIENGKWNIANNIELNAKWTAKKYTVTLNPGDGSVSETTIEVTYDQNYSLPVATNDYGAFIGWFDSDTAVTDTEGNSLSVWKFTTDKTFTTTWKLHLYSVSDLDKLYEFKNAYFELENDIDLNGIEWTPVGTASSPFTGILDGKNHKIDNLTISYLTANIVDYSLLGFTSSATIKNLKVENVNIKILTTTSIYAAAISGRDKGASLFENITTSGVIEITPQGYLGISLIPVAAGICATTSSMNAIHCTNNIDIEGASYIGGIYGFSENGSTRASYLINNGEIESYSIAGGIIAETGNSSITITNSKNTGDVCAVNKAGGLIGDAYFGATIRTSCNTGFIETTDTSNNENGAGGLVGMHGKSLNVQNCYNTGNVRGSKSAGGICGGQIISSLTNGTLSTTIRSSYNSGNITGSYYIGGLMGLTNWQTTIAYSCNFGTVSGSATRETFSYINAGSVSNCYYTIAAQGSTQGTQTSERYSSELYSDLLFWNIKTELNNGIWVLNDDTYPTLAWELN